MSERLLILRPEPGAGETAARARAIGFEPVVRPLFEARPRAWTLPQGPFDAVLMTSANAARHGGPQLAGLRALPLYAVGEATAAAARAVGFVSVSACGPDLMTSFAALRADRRAHVLHLAGEHRTEGDPGGLRIETAVVYAAESIEPPPALPLEDDPVVLLHSARAARRFVELAPGRALRIAAISPAVARAAGEGWRAVGAAAEPTDDALLETAARMCKGLA